MLSPCFAVLRLTVRVAADSTMRFRLSMNCPTHPSPVGHRQYVLAPWSESTSSGSVWGSVIEDHALGSGLLFLANPFGHFRICQIRRGMSTNIFINFSASAKWLRLTRPLRTRTHTRPHTRPRARAYTHTHVYIKGSNGSGLLCGHNRAHQWAYYVSCYRYVVILTRQF